MAHPQMYAIEMFQLKPTEDIVDIVMVSPDGTRDTTTIGVPRDDEPIMVMLILLEGTFSENEFRQYVSNTASPKTMATTGTAQGAMGAIEKDLIVNCDLFQEGAFRLTEYQHTSFKLAITLLQGGGTHAPPLWMAMTTAKNLGQQMIAHDSNIGTWMMASPRPVGPAPAATSVGHANGTGGPPPLPEEHVIAVASSDAL